MDATWCSDLTSTTIHSILLGGTTLGPRLSVQAAFAPTANRSTEDSVRKHIDRDTPADLQNEGPALVADLLDMV